MKFARSTWIAIVIALMFVTAGIGLDTTMLATWFKHHHHMSEAIPNGARLLRIMLVVLGVVLVPATLALRAPRNDADGPHPWSVRERFTMLGLVIMAIVARFPRLTESLWYDEIAAWRDYAVHGPGSIIGTYFDPSNHILNSLLTWLSADLVGADEFGLRLPAFVFSLLAIPAVHAMARTCVSPRTAVWASLVTALAPVFVLEGVESRGYAMMIAASATMTALLLANLHNERRWRWILYAIVAGLGIWAHMMTVWVPIGHALWLGWRGWRRRDHARMLRGWTSIALGAVWTITLYAPVIPYILRIRGMYAGRADTPTIFGIEGWHTVLQAGGAWSWWSALPGITLAAIGLIAGMRSQDDPRRRDLLGASLLCLPVMVAAITVFDAWMYARFALFMMPGAAVCMAIGIETLWSRRASTGMLALVGLLGVWAGDLITRPSKQPLREAAGYISERTEPNEIVLVVCLRAEVLMAYQSTWRMSFAYNHGQNIDAALDAGPIRWAVVYYPKKVTPETYQTLRARGFERVETWPGWLDWGQGDVEVWGTSRQD